MLIIKQLIPTIYRKVYNQSRKISITPAKKTLKSGNTENIKKIEKILIELSETPYSGTGNPEPLKH